MKEEQESEDINCINSTKIQNLSQSQSQITPSQHELLIDPPQYLIQKPKKTKWTTFDIILLFMFVVLLLVSFAVLITYILVESVPTLYTDAQMSKSLSDNKKYEVIQLLNGIEAMLVYEPDSFKPSVGLAIDIGYSGDEADGVLGLGALVRLILLDKNTKLNKAMIKLSDKHFGGPIRGLLGLFETAYSHDIGREGHKEALELIARIIKKNIEDDNDDDVTLNEKIENGIETLQHNFANEDIRGNQLFSMKNIIYTLLNYGISYNPLGKQDTFINSTFTMNDLKKKVIQYYKDNYVGHKMKLVVTSGLPIKEIRGIVIKLFSDIPGSYTPLKSSSQTKSSSTMNLPISKQKLGKVLFLKYKAKTNHFRLLFLFDNVPNDTNTYYFKFITYLFKDKSEGSLVSLLISYNLVTTISAFLDHFKEDTYFLTLNIILTDNGRNKPDLILEMIFNFIRIIRERKPDQTIYNDMRTIHNKLFQFREEAENTYVMVDRFVRDMIKYKEKLPYIQYRNEYVPSYNKEFNDAMFDLMTPENALVVISENNISGEGLKKLMRKFTDGSDLEYKKDNIFSTTYAMRDFNADYLNTLHNINKYDNKLSIIQKNSYLTQLNDLVSPANETEKIKVRPKLVFSMNHLKLYHKLDRTFRVPKIHGDFLIYSPFYPSNQRNSYSYYLYHAYYVRYAIDKVLNDAQEAGATIILAINNEKMNLHIRAYTDVFERIMASIFDIFFNVDKELIDRNFILSQVRLANTIFNTNYFSQNSNALFTSLLKNNLWSHFKCSSDFDDPLINQKIQKVSNQSIIEAILYGDIDEANATRITKSILQNRLELNSTIFSQQHQLFGENEVLPFFAEVKDFHNYIILRIENDRDDYAFVGNYFYYGSSIDYNETILMDLLNLVFLNEYRGELLKLGYARADQVKIHLGNNTYFSIIASGHKDPREINADLDRVFLKIEDKLFSLDEKDELYKLKLNLIAEYTKKERNLNDRTSKVYAQLLKTLIVLEPSENDYSIETINKLFTKQRLIEYYNKRFKTEIKKLSVQVNYTKYVTLEPDIYLLNPEFQSVVTEDINYFHK